MKKLIYIQAFSTLALLAGCDSAPASRAPAAATAPDTAGTTSAVPAPPVAEAAPPDTTLQPIEELTLRATGNELQQLAFDQDTLEVKAGSLVKLTFINEGSGQSMIHNVVFTDSGTYKQVALAGGKIGAPGNYVPDNPVVIAASPLALPGQTVEMEFTAPAPGVYEYVCTYPEHWQHMHGNLIVK